MDILDWIQKWYISNCDGDWEHENIIKIQTIDNPGFVVDINLHFTVFDNISFKTGLVENSEEDWYNIIVEDSHFRGFGDPTKLKFILEEFKRLVEEHIEKY